jgi:hypothetical protein
MLCGPQVNSGANGRSTCKSAEVAKARRCRRALFHYVGAPAHVDGKVFRAMATPMYVRLEREALGLIDFAP